MRIDIGQLEYIDKNLRDMLVWVEKETGYEFTITSQYRIGDNGVHGSMPLRGTDLRVRNFSVGKQIEELTNDAWIYDADRPGKKCAMLHGDSSNLHLHLQVHPNTFRRA